jgi:hypothetical protein
MRTLNDNSAVKGPREWWLTPPRSGIRRLTNPSEYCHIRAIGVRIEALP